ncbi:MAG: type II secretion system F family protein [Patescibacteria group bacterium]
MPLYSYKARDKKGKVIKEVIQASSAKEAASNLKSEGLQVLTVKSMESKLGMTIGGGISTSEKATFCRFLATMLRAGLPLPKAVDIISKETPSKRFQKILLDVSFQTRKGASLFSVFSNYKNDLGTVFLTMVRAGEESGTLDKSFDYLAKQLMTAHEMTQKVKGALIYPAVIVVAMLGNAVVMLTFVLPKISDVFSKLAFELPPTTKLVLGIGSFVGSNMLLVIGVIIGLIILSVLALIIRSTRQILLTIITKVPLVKKLRDQIDVSRFARTLSTLLKTGVPIMEALDVAADLISQPKLQKQAKKFSEGVSKGEALSDLLVKEGKVFPQVLVQTVKAGEESGALEQVLLEMAEFYEKEVNHTLKRLTSLIEPLFMLLIGIAVGAMVLMMVVPIYSIVGSFDSTL